MNLAQALGRVRLLTRVQPFGSSVTATGRDWATQPQPIWRTGVEFILCSSHLALGSFLQQCSRCV